MFIITQEENKKSEKHNDEKAADHIDNKELIGKIADENDDTFRALVDK